MSNINIVSTGDDEEDRRQIQGFITSDRLRAEGMCPNGHGPLDLLSETEMECPACGFYYSRHVFHAE